jgi:hypothetical protein
MRVILSDLHDCFQIVTGRESADCVSDAMAAGEVCPKVGSDERKKRPLRPQEHRPLDF